MKTLETYIFDTGYCTHPQHIPLRNHSWRSMKFYSMFAAIIHPKEGVILFDTGYSADFKALTRGFPEYIYQLTTPVYLRKEDAAVEKLRPMGIDPADVRHIIISHFHADHVGALRDFPRAKFWFHTSAWRYVRSLGRWSGVFKGFLRSVLPDDFTDRMVPISAVHAKKLPPECVPFLQGYDLFGDESILAVPLPGHAVGQLGAIIHTQGGRRIFFVADACWTSLSYRQQRMPHPITKILFSDTRVYQRTLEELHQYWILHPDQLLAPSHCPEIHALLANRGSC